MWALYFKGKEEWNIIGISPRIKEVPERNCEENVYEFELPKTVDALT